MSHPTRSTLAIVVPWECHPPSRFALPPTTVAPPLFAHKEIYLLFGFDNNNLNKLERTLFKVQSLVDNVRSINHSSSCSSYNKAQHLWLRDTQNPLYEVEDFLDEITLEISKLASADVNVDFTNKQVRNLVFSKFKFIISSQMVKMQNKLQELAREMDGSFVDELHKLGMPYSTVGNFQSSLLLDESVVIGRESDKREVIKLLLDEKMGGRSNLSVIAIVGMEGVGKTILAQLVYNNVDLDSNFNLENWVSVFVEYNIERVTRSIFECACREKVKLSDLEPIQMRLEEILNGKKFLIVVDGF
ncbi:hypothetical protein S83_070575 [Arachis hypogaea]